MELDREYLFLWDKGHKSKLPENHFARRQVYCDTQAKYNYTQHRQHNGITILVYQPHQSNLVVMYKAGEREFGFHQLLS